MVRKKKLLNQAKKAETKLSFGAFGGLKDASSVSASTVDTERLLFLCVQKSTRHELCLSLQASTRKNMERILVEIYVCMFSSLVLKLCEFFSLKKLEPRK